MIRFRWLIWELAVRDLALRYRGSALGFLWSFLNPVFYVATYSFAFSVVLKSSIPDFTAFLLCGIIPWQWFSSAIMSGTNSIVDGRMFIGKTIFRPSVLVIAPIVSNFINYSIFIPILIAYLLFREHTINVSIIALLLVVPIQFLMTAGILFITATLNVFFRDVKELIATLVNLLFFLTPIFYPLQQVPVSIRTWEYLNPMTGIALAYQEIFYYSQWPNWKILGCDLLFAGLIFLIGSRLARKFEQRIPEFL